MSSMPGTVASTSAATRTCSGVSLGRDPLARSVLEQPDRAALVGVVGAEVAL
jgi:hypothetical protein